MSSEVDELACAEREKRCRACSTPVRGISSSLRFLLAPRCPVSSARLFLFPSSFPHTRPQLCTVCLYSIIQITAAVQGPFQNQSIPGTGSIGFRVLRRDPDKGTSRASNAKGGLEGHSTACSCFTPRHRHTFEARIPCCGDRNVCGRHQGCHVNKQTHRPIRLNPRARLVFRHGLSVLAPFQPITSLVDRHELSSCPSRILRFPSIHPMPKRGSYAAILLRAAIVHLQA